LVILADEPTGNLDTTTSEEILALLQKLHEEGKTIITVTHDEAVALQTQRIIQLKDGEVQKDERVDAVPDT
ncbi:MAG: macrolide ABC transporter ATP-binding protein, partial [Planctomycetota bacterium]|nr:macrolide ABC transporter ATP-binding protein [Planctomycetota bacterium]